MNATRTRRHRPVSLFDANALTQDLKPQDYFAAAKRAFLLHGRTGATQSVLHLALDRGGVHVKAARLPAPAHLVCVKTNANLPGNPQRGLPTIQGLILAFDARTGTPLAVLDSASLTAQRTAAATAVAMRALANRDVDSIAIVGCGVQGRVHLDHLTAALRVRRVLLFDRLRERAESLALRARRPRLEVRVARTLREATHAAGIVVCCTPSTRPFLRRSHLADGAVVAAIGADNADKRELHDDLLASARFVVDSLDQCASMGEWHHRPADLPLTAAVELGAVLRGEQSGRRRADEILVFDSTGMALQDACAVAAILKRQRTTATFDFSGETARARILRSGGSRP